MDDDFEAVGSIAGRWLKVAPGASLDSHQAPSGRGGGAAHKSAGGGGGGGGLAAVVGTLGADNGALAVALDALTLDELDSLAAAVQDAQRRRQPGAGTSATTCSRSQSRPQQPQARQPRATGSSAVAKPATRTPRGGRAGVGADGDDELDGGGIAGLWLQVPPGGTLPSSAASSSQPTGTPRGTSSARPRAPASAAAPKKQVLGWTDDLD